MSGDGACGRVTALDEPRDQPQDEEIEEEPEIYEPIWIDEHTLSGLLDE